MLYKSKGRSKSSKSILVTSDMHTGHKFAIHTGEFEKIPKILQPLHDLWYSTPDKLLNKNPDIFFINGEPIDGDNPKELGHQLWSNDMADQLKDARKLVDIFKFKTFGINRGSNYHTTKNNTSFEKLFELLIENHFPIINYSPFDDNCIKTVNTTEWGNSSHHKFTRIDDIFMCRLNNRVFHIMHHIGGSKWFSYLPTALGREMAQMVFYDGKLWKKSDSPSIIIRSHTHRYVQIRYASQYGVVTPAWKIFDRFSTKNGQDAASVGMVEFVVEPNGKVEINEIMLHNEYYPKMNIVNVV